MLRLVFLLRDDGVLLFWNMGGGNTGGIVG